MIVHVLFSVLKIKQFVLCEKRNTIGKYPAFLGLFVWIENLVKCNACAVNQKFVTTWVSRNAVISTEPIVRIS